MCEVCLSKLPSAHLVRLPARAGRFACRRWRGGGGAISLMTYQDGRRACQIEGHPALAVETVEASLAAAAAPV